MKINPKCPKCESEFICTDSSGKSVYACGTTVIGKEWKQSVACLNTYDPFECVSYQDVIVHLESGGRAAKGSWMERGLYVRKDENRKCLMMHFYDFRKPAQWGSMERDRNSNDWRILQ